MVEIGAIDADSDDPSTYEDSRSLQEASQRVGTYRLYEVADDEEEDKEGKVIAHLYVVRQDLQSRKKSCQSTST